MTLGHFPLARLGAAGWALTLVALTTAAAQAQPTPPVGAAPMTPSAPTPILAPATPSSTAAKHAGGREVRIRWPAIVAAVERHPAVAASRYERAAADSEVDAAGAAPNPNLELTSAYGRARDGSASRVEWGAELTIPLGWVAQRRSKIDAAQAHADAVGATTEAVERELLVELHGLFYDLVYAQARVSALAELGEQTSTLAATVRRRIAAGESRPVEAARVEVEEERVLAELAVARSEAESHGRQLALWLGLPPAEQPVAVADMAALPRPPSADVVRSRVRERHPAVVAATARMLALDADVSAERRTRVPDFAVSVFADSELDRSAYGATLSIDLPLWNHNTGNIRRAEAALAAGRKHLEAQRLGVEAAAIELQASCQASVTLATRYRDRVRPRAAEATRSIERSYEVGESSLLEVLDARRTFLETHTAFLGALARAQSDCSRLAVLLGEHRP